MDTVPQAAAGRSRSAGRRPPHGRGACDTKASCAAMLAAVARLAREDVPHATVVFAAVVDEESGMAGARALARGGPAVDFAVIGEPTSLRPIRVHNGVVRFALVAHGAAAHTSTAHLGVNAIARRHGRSRRSTASACRARRSHPLDRRGAADARGRRGRHARSTPCPTAARCASTAGSRRASRPRRRWRRSTPRSSRCAPRATAIVREEPTLVLSAAETAADDPLVRAAERSAGEVLGEPVTAGGAPYCTDACVLSGEHGIPFAVLGPGSIEQAHTPGEWVRWTRSAAPSRSTSPSRGRSSNEEEPMMTDPGQDHGGGDGRAAGGAARPPEPGRGGRRGARAHARAARSPAW